MTGVIVTFNDLKALERTTHKVFDDQGLHFEVDSSEDILLEFSGGVVRSGPDNIADPFHAVEIVELGAPSIFAEFSPRDGTGFLLLHAAPKGYPTPWVVWGSGLVDNAGKTRFLPSYFFYDGELEIVDVAGRFSSLVAWHSESLEPGEGPLEAKYAAATKGESYEEKRDRLWAETPPADRYIDPDDTPPDVFKTLDGNLPILLVYDEVLYSNEIFRIETAVGVGDYQTLANGGSGPRDVYSRAADDWVVTMEGDGGTAGRTVVATIPAAQRQGVMALVIVVPPPDKVFESWGPGAVGVAKNFEEWNGALMVLTRPEQPIGDEAAEICAALSSGCGS